MHKKALTSTVSRPYNWFCAVQQYRVAGGSQKASRHAGRAARTGNCRNRSHGAASLNSTMKGTLPCTTLPNNSPNSTRPTSRKRTKLAALAHRKRREAACKLNLNAAKVVLAQGVEGADGRRRGQGRAGPDGAAAPSTPRPGVQTAIAYSQSLYEISSRSASAILGARRRSVVGVHEGRRRRGSRRPASRRRPVRKPLSTRSSRRFAATTAAFDQFQKATKQVVSLADAACAPPPPTRRRLPRRAAAPRKRVRNDDAAAAIAGGAHEVAGKGLKARTASQRG